MSSLAGRTLDASYKELLKISPASANTGIDGTLRTVEDGFDNDSALQISSSGVKSTGTLSVDGLSALTTLTVSGATTLSSTLGVTGASTLGTTSATGLTVSGTLSCTGTGALIVPKGSTVQQPSPAELGMFRYNTTLNRFEGYMDTGWGEIGGGGGGGGSGGTSLYVRQTFTATANQTTFTITGGYTAYKVDVFQNGIKLANSEVGTSRDVDVSSGSTIVLATGASAGDVIDVVGLASGNFAGPATARRQTFTATAGQTTFTVTGGYTPGQLDVFQNGTKLLYGTDVNVSDGATVVLTTGANLNDTIEVVGFTAADTISGTLQFQAGTAAAPSITTFGDTNTGIFFPAADTIAFSEGGTESMRIDSSGNVGIGTTSPTSKLDIKSANAAGAIQLTATTGTNGSYANFVNSSGAFIIGKDSSTGNNLVGAPYSSCLYSQGAYPMIFCTDSTERLRINSSGNVGIGTTSPSTKLDVNGDTKFGGTMEVWGIEIGKAGLTGNRYAGIDFTGDDTYTDFGLRILRENTGANANSYIQTRGTGTFVIQTTEAGPIVMTTNSAERLRITSGGEVYIAGTTDQGAYNLQVNGTGVWGAGAYVNGSDERLKENIQDITSGLDVVEKLRPVSFQYKEEYTADRSIQSGFIAQDLLVALEGKNYLEGVVSQGPTYYNVAYQNLIPILAKAIQELKAENDSLKARIEILEAA